MKRGSLVFYILTPALIIFTFLFYQYIIKVYESTIEVEPEHLFADNQSTLKITVIPLNGFGWKALFRNSPAEFEIVEGKALVEVVLEDNESGEIILKAKSETGKIVVRIKSKHSLLPMMVEVFIQPNVT